MRRPTRIPAIAAIAAGLALGCLATSAPAQQMLTTRSLLEGLQQPQGVAIHPDTGDIYFTEMGAGRLMRIVNNRPESALPPNWQVSEELPRWAVSAEMPKSAWMAATLQKPGALTIASNGVIYVAEQVPRGRILEFTPNEQGVYQQAKAIPVPWLSQGFQWRALEMDPLGRLFIAGADEAGSPFLKFGSCLVRQPDGDWWTIDFGPFANYTMFAFSERRDFMLLGDRTKGNLTWWEIGRQIILGGSPNAAGRAQLAALSIYRDGSFILGLEEEGQAIMRRMDPFSGQMTTVADGFRSIGDITVDRPGKRYLVTDPAAGRIVECAFPPTDRFNEFVLRQIVRSVEGMVSDIKSEAPAFLTSFMDRLQSAAQDMVESTHAVDFNLSDIAGTMPVVAGRVRMTVEVEGMEVDPLESLEFFLLFPSKVVMTESSATPSLGFFSAQRKSGKIEQTKPIFKGNVNVMRLSGTNITRLVSGTGGLHVPVITCGLENADGGVRVNLAFLGMGVYDDYYLSLFQSPQEQSAKLVVNSGLTESGTTTYEASFMDDATMEGMEGTTTREQLTNLLISGFEGGAAGVNRSVGWMRLGQYPASMSVAFDDADETVLTGGTTGLREIVERKAIERQLETGADIEAIESTAPPAAADTPAEAAP